MTGEKNLFPGKLYWGQDLVVAGFIGQLGTKVLVKVRREWLSQWFSQSYLQGILSQNCPLAADFLTQAGEFGATAAGEAREGGIFKALWDFSGAHQVGISFSVRKIPIWQAAVEVCERCGGTPYRLWCGNCILFGAENGGRLADFFQEQGIPASVIGKVKKGISREMEHGEEKGYLERPREDELFRILGRERVEKDALFRILGRDLGRK